MAENFDVAFRRIQQTEQQLDGGGFAGTVRAEQAENFAFADFKIHAVHRARLRAVPEILEDLRQAADGNDHLVRFLISDLRLRI